MTSGQPPTLVAGSLLGGRFLFHSFWKLRGVANLQSLRCGVARRLLPSHANERSRTIVVNDGSSRPDSHVLLVSHLYLRQLSAAPNNWAQPRF